MAIPIPLPQAVEPLFALPPPKSVGVRNTVVAFALVSIFQILAKDPTELSAQFLYWACKERDGFQGDVGTSPLKAARVLQEVGVCTEATWPYQPTPSDKVNPGHGPPPPGAIEEAKRRRLRRCTMLPATSVSAIKTALALGKPVLLGLHIWEHWNNSWQGRVLGRLRTPLPGERQGGGTALCIVGYRDDDSAPGCGYFIARNYSYSGTEWARANPDGPGHCHVPYKLVAEQGLVAIAFEGVVIEPADQPSDTMVTAPEIAQVSPPIPRTNVPFSGSLVFLNGEAVSGNEELYPNGVSPDGQPLLRIDAVTAYRLAQGMGGSELKERVALYKAKLNGF